MPWQSEIIKTCEIREFFTHNKDTRTNRTGPTVAVVFRIDTSTLVVRMDTRVVPRFYNPCKREEFMILVMDNASKT